MVYRRTFTLKPIVIILYLSGFYGLPQNRIHDLLRMIS